jgi:hypothetical protein
MCRTFIRQSVLQDGAAVHNTFNVQRHLTSTSSRSFSDVASELKMPAPELLVVSTLYQLTVS